MADAEATFGKGNPGRGSPPAWPFLDRRYPAYEGFRGGGPLVRCGNCGGTGTTATSADKEPDYTCAVCGGEGALLSTYGRATRGEDSGAGYYSGLIRRGVVNG